MPLPIALQLYSVREQAKEDYAGTVRTVAEMGYAGVEPAGFPGSSVEEAAKLFSDLGLSVPSAHGALPVGDDANRVLDEAETLGTQRVVAGRGPDFFTSIEKIKETCDLFNEAAGNAAKRGMSFGIHNHWWEFQEVEGQLAADVMVQHLTPDVFLQIDTYWVKVAGQDPVEMVRKFGPKVQSLHIKDGPCVREEPMTAVGKGKMNFAPILDSASHAEWQIVELDSCGTDMMQAVRESVEFLRENNLGTGR